MGFNLIYWTPMSGYYFFVGSNLEKYGKFWKNGRFFRADMAGLGKYSMGGYGRIGVYRVTELHDTGRPTRRCGPLTNQRDVVFQPHSGPKLTDNFRFLSWRAKQMAGCIKLTETNHQIAIIFRRDTFKFFTRNITAVPLIINQVLARILDSHILKITTMQPTTLTLSLPLV